MISLDLPIINGDFPGCQVRSRLKLSQCRSFSSPVHDLPRAWWAKFMVQMNMISNHPHHPLSQLWIQSVYEQPKWHLTILEPSLTIFGLLKQAWQLLFFWTIFHPIILRHSPSRSAVLPTFLQDFQPYLVPVAIPVTPTQGHVWQDRTVFKVPSGKLT